MENRMVYLDNNATTPTDPRVLAAMLPFFYDQPGNAASRTHAFGWQAEEAVAVARRQVATLIEADPAEIVFTSGATEAVNLAIKGVYENYSKKGKHIITLRTEHNAVLDTCQNLEEKGAEVSYLDVDQEGLVEVSVLEAAIREDTILVAVMWANNETGVIQPMEAIGEVCARKGALLFSDATQAVGKIPVKPYQSGIHLLAFSSHKMYGPKGVGGLYVRKKNPLVKIRAQIDGGKQERGRRSGTLNVPGIVGMGKAAALAALEMDDEAARLASWRDHIERRLLTELEGVFVNGNRQFRLPQTTNIRFEALDAEQLLMMFSHHLALSSGSACTSASLDPSHVLIALGLSEKQAYAAIRIGFGRFNKQEDADFAADTIIKAVKEIRADNPAWETFLKNGKEKS